MSHQGYVPIFQAPDEMTANLIKAILEAEGIDALVHSHQVAWMDSIMVTAEGFWGDVLVREEEAERARKILEAYEAGSGFETKEEEDQ